MAAHFLFIYLFISVGSCKFG